MTNSLLILKSPNKGNKWAAASPLATHTLKALVRECLFLFDSLVHIKLDAYNFSSYIRFSNSKYHEENHNTFDARSIYGCYGSEYEKRAYYG